MGPDGPPAGQHLRQKSSLFNQAWEQGLQVLMHSRKTQGWRTFGQVMLMHQRLMILATIMVLILNVVNVIPEHRVSPPLKGDFWGFGFAFAAHRACILWVGISGF